MSAGSSLGRDWNRVTGIVDFEAMNLEDAAQESAGSLL
jgi:hypothetical protein